MYNNEFNNFQFLYLLMILAGYCDLKKTLSQSESIEWIPHDQKNKISICNYKISVLSKFNPILKQVIGVSYVTQYFPVW